MTITADMVSSSPGGLRQRPGRGWRRVAGIAMAVVALLSGAGRTAVAVPPAGQQAQALRGCCLCRGPVNGQPHAAKSCTDNLAVESCELQCKSQSATSFVFGNAQSCVGGCAGFATQNLK